MEKNLKKKGKLFSIAKDCEVEVSLQEDGFKGSWFRAILEQNPMRVKGKKLRVCYKTLFNEDGVNPCKETIERCFIRSVPPECLNEGVVFKEGSVVDAYFNNGWWTGLIIVERPDGSFFIYFDDPPDIMRFIRSQLRPPANWIGSEWVKSKNKVLSQHIFRTGKLIEMTPEISETEGKHSIVDICKIMPSPPRDLCAEYSLNDYVEVVVTHGWRKGRVMEILLENNYKVYFTATKEDAVFNYTEIRLSMEWLDGGSWIRAHEREFENNAVTPIRPAQESPSNTLVLESNEDDTVNDDATEIKSSRESHSNTSFLEATETETQNHEPVDGVELPLPHESDDMMDDVATPIIDPQEIPRGERMSKSDDKIALPKRISEPGTNGGVLDRINKRSNLKLVGTVENVLGREFKKLEDSFLAPVIKMGMRQKYMVFSRHLIHHLLLRRIDIGKKDFWFSFGEQLMRFSLREFHLAMGLPCVVDKDEEEVETSETKNKKKDPWMKKNQTLNTLLNLLVKKSTKLTADQRLRLGATILVEGILMASNPVTSIPEELLLRARNFKEFCKYPWGNLAFDYLWEEVESFTYTKLTEKDQYAICGFIYPLQLWALSSVNQPGTFDKMEEVDVKCIFGDPELHSDLVEDVDSEFGRVVDLVKRGYRLKREDWLNGSVDIAVAEAEVDENNSAPGIDATDQEKIKFLTKMVVSLEEKVKYLEGLLNIRGETVKETEKSKETEADTKTKNADYKSDETEFLQNYIDAKRQEIAKGKKNGVRPPREVDHQDEDDIEVEHGAKESDTSKVNEPQEENKHHEEDDTEVDVDDSAKGNENSETNKGHTQEEEEQQQEDDTEVNADVDVGAKESENSETNEDGEVNEDASKKPVKVTKKCGRGNKGKKKSVKPPREVQQQVEDDAEIGAKESENPETNEDGEMNEDASKKPVKVTKKRGRGNKGMKKGVTPPREVQQQVEDDADVDDGEVNEDASKKPVKGTKKHGRETKGMKKGVAPTREVQQQVEDDAEVDAKESENPKTDEDGEVNEDASKKQVKFTKKRGRVTKEPNVDTSKSKRQKKQEDSAADAIGRVLEDLKKNQLEASRI
uniref:Agenet domain containing protein n=1 Tax=Brassica oleracea TaxID=3712 RepID=Q2A9L5_BRAOL|nr:Agenet domain containing protein [Brassica oleracea]